MAMLNRQIATSLASVLLFEDEVRRSKEVAEMATLQREQMSLQLQLQTGRMRRMTELSPMGMFLFTPEGLLLEANDRYYEMTGVSSTGDKLPWSIDMMVGKSKRVAQEMWDCTRRSVLIIITYTNIVVNIQTLSPNTNQQAVSYSLRIQQFNPETLMAHGSSTGFWQLVSQS
jgi:PAS domain-containing protein